MEYLTNLMQLVDLNSKIISEGDYLKMCDSLKKIHDHIKYDDSESEDEFVVRRVDIPIPFTTTPRLPPLEDDLEEDDVTVYDTVPPSTHSRRGDFIHLDLPPVLTPSPSIREMELENELYDVNRRIHETEKKYDALKHRKNITSFVKKEAVKQMARDLNVRLPRYTFGALIDKGFNLGNERHFYKEYIKEYNDDIDEQKSEINEILLELDRERRSIIDELINF